MLSVGSGGGSGGSGCSGCSGCSGGGSGCSQRHRFAATIFVVGTLKKRSHTFKGAFIEVRKKLVRATINDVDAFPQRRGASIHGLWCFAVRKTRRVIHAHRTAENLTQHRFDFRKGSGRCQRRPEPTVCTVLGVETGVVSWEGRGRGSGRGGGGGGGGRCLFADVEKV